MTTLYLIMVSLFCSATFFFNFYPVLFVYFRLFYCACVSFRCVVLLYLILSILTCRFYFYSGCFICTYLYLFYIYTDMFISYMCCCLFVYI